MSTPQSNLEPRQKRASSEGLTQCPVDTSAFVVRLLDPANLPQPWVCLIRAVSQTKQGPVGQEWLAISHHDKMTGAQSCQYATYQSRPGRSAACSPSQRASGVGVSVLPGGNREASVPSGSCQACRMPACSVTRSSVPEDATQRNVFWSLQLCPLSPLPASLLPPCAPTAAVVHPPKAPRRAMQAAKAALPSWGRGNHLLWPPPTKALRSTGLGCTPISLVRWQEAVWEGEWMTFLSS